MMIDDARPPQSSNVETHTAHHHTMVMGTAGDGAASQITIKHAPRAASK